jgi:hypothetical protein
VDKAAAHSIENIRKTFNPEQHRLIDCHVTLCREDEIENIAVVMDRLEKLDAASITLQFGQAIRFDHNKGVLLPASGSQESFHQLRLKILSGLGFTIRQHSPHITLMHPRNSVCTDEIFETIKKADLPTMLTFDTISYIEQVDGGEWQVLRSFKLHAALGNLKLKINKRAAAFLRPDQQKQHPSPNNAHFPPG